MTTELFDEAKYLLANPDVAKAVHNGEFNSGEEHYVKFGLLEGRGWIISESYSRARMVSDNLKLGGKGLEIGPSHNPIAPKSEGFDVDIVDHMNSSGLKQKYSAHGVDLSKIEDVDFVWNGEPLSELIGRTEYYDWVIASHVIEHMPDPITFLQQCQRLLKPDGKLALVIPDKRYCFDYFQPITMAGSLLDAFHEKRTRPTPGQVFEHLSNACVLDKKAAWNNSDSGPIEMLHGHEEAASVWRQAASCLEYFDVHCWRFTPSSFKLLLADLNALQLLEMSAVCDHDTVGSEFYCVLSKSLKKKSNFDRVKLLREVNAVF